MEAATAATKTATRAPRKRRPAEEDERRLARFMNSPSLILIAIVAAYPIGYAVWLSFHEYSVRVPGLSRGAGFRNYTSALSDSAFQSAILNTFIFTAASVF